LFFVSKKEEDSLLEPNTINVLENIVTPLTPIVNVIPKIDPVQIYYQEIDLLVYESIKQLKNIYNYANINLGKLSIRYNSGNPRLSQYSFRPLIK
jgi:hypothetical protein